MIDANPPNEYILPTFQINSAKLYIPIVTLSINDNIKFLENLKQGFKRAVSWNRYRSEITTQLKNNNLDYLIVPLFRNINIACSVFNIMFRVLVFYQKQNI